MPVQNGDGIDATLPGGALRLDVDASEATSGVTVDASGVMVRGQYGAECVMTGRLTGGAYLVQGSSIVYQPIPFGGIEVDYSEFNSLPQCDSSAGVLYANVEGLYEVGCSIMVLENGVTATAHFELAIWTDFGYSDLALQPAVPFGTANGAFGAAWQRIQQRATCVAIGTPALPTIPDAGGWPMNVATVWCVKTPVAGTFPMTSPPVTRFRFGIRSDQPFAVLGNTPAQARGWLRWLGPPA